MNEPGHTEVDLKTLVELCDDIRIELTANLETNELFVDFYGKLKKPAPFFYIDLDNI